MGLFDKIKESIDSAIAYAKMDDFLITEIDSIISSEWKKVSEKRPLGVAGISLETEAEYNFKYKTPEGVVKVELEHEFPYVEVEMSTDRRKIERKLKVGDFVEKEGSKLVIKNKDELEEIIKNMMRTLMK
jgi:hypothetical protein